MSGPDLDLELLGWPPDGPTLRLDYREFSYAGKFVMSSTGKAVARENDEVVAAVAFNEDRTDPSTMWLRYVTVRADRRGAGIGPRLVEFVVDRARERGYELVRIAVNNPFAYHALYRAGFRYTGEETGIAELVLERDLDSEAPADPDRYEAGLSLFLDRNLEEEERRFVSDKREAGPPGDRTVGGSE
ncbi:GNAT family N-acetyltransferase [Halobacteriales archaeon QS_8_69_26]|nr:MAG: GNAT family N-acetyltransferase [Halobacteriales archaeon QS_8_69_26]